MTQVKTHHMVGWMPVNDDSPLEVNPGAGIQVRIFGRSGSNGDTEVRAEIWIEDLGSDEKGQER